MKLQLSPSSRSLYGALLCFAGLAMNASAARPVAANLPPVAQNQSVRLKVDRSAWITLEATDPEGASLTFEIVTPPQHGSLNAGIVFFAASVLVEPGINIPILPDDGPFKQYTPTAGYSGPDSFTFRASDGKKASNVATVTLDVTTANQAPQAWSFEERNKRESKTFLFFPTSDPDGDPTSVVIKTQPQHGTLRLATEEEYPTWYADAPLDPGFGHIALGEPLPADGPINIDGIGDGLPLPVDAGPFNTMPTFIRPYVYEQHRLLANAPAPTADSFTFAASDGTDESAPATVSLTLLPPNVPPVVVVGVDPAIERWTTTATTVLVTRAGGKASAKLDTLDSTDPDGDPYSLSTQWSGGSAEVTWGSEAYFDLGVGTHLITASVSDVERATTDGTVTVLVISPASAAQRLDADLTATGAPAKALTSLRATLKAASEAFAKNKPRVGVAKLTEFARAVRGKLGRSHAKQAAGLASTAQQVVDSATGKASSSWTTVTPMVR